jgi:hypothetical protein
MIHEICDYVWNHKGTIAPAVVSTLAAGWSWWKARDTRKHAAELDNQRRKFDSDMKLREKHFEELSNERARRFEFALQQVAFLNQPTFAQVAIKRIEALEHFNKGFTELHEAIMMLKPDIPTETFAKCYELVNRNFLDLWKDHASRQMFLSENLSAKIYDALHKIHALAINKEMVHELKRDGEAWRDFYRQEGDILQKIDTAIKAVHAEVRAIWEVTG